MADLSVTYMGFKLKNPIIVGSSSLSGNADAVKRCEEAGAGAIALKSIFEEQIMAEANELERQSQVDAGYHPEAMEYIYRMGMEHSRGEYLRFVEKAAKAAGVPLFASLNCVSRGGWTDYARKLVDAGASGLELNMYITPQDPHTPGSMIEKTYYDIVADIKAKVNIPVAVKLSPFFTNFYSVVENLEAQHVDALVLFNRYFHFDIDTDKLELVPGSGFSSPQEMELPLRWITLMSAIIRCDIAATTGIVDGRSAVKQMLAGARAVQVSSVLYRRGVSHIGVILSEMEDWMKSHDFADTSAFTGKLARKHPEHPGMYDRVQFIKAYVGLD